MSNTFVTVKALSQTFLRSKHMQNNRFILAGLLAIALTACGGGGGSGDSGVKVNDSVSGGDDANTNTKIVGKQHYLDFPMTGFSSVESDKLTKFNIKYLENGEVKTYTFDFEQDMPGFNSPWIDNSSDNLIVNGKKMPNIVLNNTLSYARFGMIAGLDTQSQAILFHQGEVTPANSIPVSGTATYKGDAFVVDMADANKRTTDAKSEFDVDFAKKSVKGTISNINIDGKQYNNVEISAKITKDNKLALGHYIGGSTDPKTLQRMDGAFYGKNADEMAGVFEDKQQNISGGFGAKKQK